jgi:multicomponent Na+:H+ antiporter subunit E
MNKIKMNKIKSQFILFLILELFWILWNNTLNIQIWLLGGIFSLITVLFFGKSAEIFIGVKLTPKGLINSFLYIIVFIIAVIKSNIDVLFRVLNPKLPIRPGIVRIKTKLKNPMARLILANSITLTPGTFVVEIIDQYIYVHWIDVKYERDEDRITKEIAGNFEKILLRIYE